eukprot:scaffold220963_cov30-Tisochrysis_lutea.AAC.2
MFVRENADRSLRYRPSQGACGSWTAAITYILLRLSLHTNGILAPLPVPLIDLSALGQRACKLLNFPKKPSLVRLRCATRVKCGCGWMRVAHAHPCSRARMSE